MRTVDALLPELTDLVTRYTGLRFTDERHADLERGLRATARELGFMDVPAYGLWLLSSPLTEQHIAVLVSHLTVGETYFFRDRPAFQALSERILPALIQRRRQEGHTLRIWSAGCATGEEIYSIAIILTQLIPDLDDWHITLLGTDINADGLKKAVAGLFGNWSFRDNSALSRDRHFTPTADGRFRIHQRYRRMVKFSWLNLADDNYPSASNDTHSMDIVLCRNVLMYFTPQAATAALRQLHASLVDGGWLLVAPSEAPHGVLPGFRTVSQAGCTLYRKGDETTDPPAPLLPEPDGVYCYKQPLHGHKLAFSPASANPLPDPYLSANVATSLVLPTSPQPGTKQRDRHAPEPLEDLPSSSHADDIRAAPPAKAVEACTGIAVVSRMARSCANEGRLDEAAAWCEQAMRLDKMDPAHSFLYASIREEQARFEEAERLLRRALYLDPDFVLAHVALGHLALRRDAADDSRRHFANALDLLRRCRHDETVPHSDGITAGRLMEIVRNMITPEERLHGRNG